MNTDIGEAARSAVRVARERDFRGDWSQSEDRCTAMIVDIVRPPVGRSADKPDARQERIDATARAIFAATFVDEEDEDASPGALRDLYPDGFEAKLAADCDAAHRFAIALEAARERALAKEGTR